jgi:uncharacterized protein (TIGR03000 family)
VVTLPTEASLTIDGTATTSTSSVRRFETPPLQVGQTYSYTLEAKDGDGTDRKTITVRAGEETAVTLAPTRAVSAR